MIKRSAQAAMEYLILLGVMVIIALTAFRTLVPGAQSETNQAFIGGAANIIGENAEMKTGVAGPWPMDDPPPAN